MGTRRLPRQRAPRRRIAADREPAPIRGCPSGWRRGRESSASPRRLGNYVAGEWATGSGKQTDLFHAVTGDKVAEASTNGIDYSAMVDHARLIGGPALRKLTFHERARRLKALAMYFMERKEAFYAVSAMQCATSAASWIDIEGGIGTLFAYSSRGRRELPDETFYIDGATEALSKGGQFVGRHICVPL